MSSEKQRLDGAAPSNVVTCLKETGEKLKALGGGEVPDPAELDDEDRARYEELKADFAYYKSLYEAAEGISTVCSEEVGR